MKKLFLDFCKTLADPKTELIEKLVNFGGFITILFLLLFIVMLLISGIVSTKGFLLIPIMLVYVLYKVMIAIGKLNG